MRHAVLCEAGVWIFDPVDPEWIRPNAAVKLVMFAKSINEHRVHLFYGSATSVCVCFSPRGATDEEIPRYNVQTTQNALQLSTWRRHRCSSSHLFPCCMRSTTFLYTRAVCGSFSRDAW